MSFAKQKFRSSERSDVLKSKIFVSGLSCSNVKTPDGQIGGFGGGALLKSKEQCDGGFMLARSLFCSLSLGVVETSLGVD